MTRKRQKDAGTGDAGAGQDGAGVREDAEKENAACQRRMEVAAKLQQYARMEAAEEAEARPGAGADQEVVGASAAEEHELSYAKKDSFFEHEISSSSFHHTFPGQRAQHKALVHLLQNLGWTWVGIISSEDESSQRSSVKLKEKLRENGICIEFAITLHKDGVGKDILAFETLQKSSCNAVILNVNLDEPIFFEVAKKKTFRKVLISLFSFPNFVNADIINHLNGSLMLSLHKVEIPGLKNFLLAVDAQKYDNYFILSKMWKKIFWCLPVNFMDESVDSCNETYGVHLYDGLLYDVENFRVTFQVYAAVYALAHALHDLIEQSDKEEASLDSQWSWQHWKLSRYLKNIHFETMGGEEVYFNKEGHFSSKFDIINLVGFPNKSLQRRVVGYYEESSDRFRIDSGAIVWSPKFSQMPTSVCSARCLPGYQKIQLKGRQECCYDCGPCPERQISNKTDMERCLKCPEDHRSNEVRDTCIPRTLEFLSYNDPLGLCLIVIALLFCLLTTLILWMFSKYKHTAIVRANNRNLSFILLLSLLLSFLCPLLFIGQPTKMSCLIRQVAFGNIFTIAVSSVLAKTVTVVLAFRATKPDTSLRRYLGRHLATSLLLVSCFGEFLICVFWLCLAPPFPVYNTELEVGKIILQCNEGSTIAFYMAIGYIGFLAVLSFIVAFMARRLPDTFNEAQYITFSMLVFCSVWISFIPAYLSTKGKYMVAVEVFAISASSAGLLGCIFIPKCYVILLRPELNTKSNLVVRNVKKT
ncbi:vomeronasal type-2 receptor 26-like [Ranitomeya imitator]|uniref:vomeronasal type-2 receptor 26-like n=1 Tax=Ranitomeya imitator TaxID=111125 RepID=UPI0037E775AF